MARPGGLGKGLGALIPAGTSEPRPATDDGGGSGLQEVAVSAIQPNPYQPRYQFDEESLGALADSIREVGVLQPVLVRPAGDGFELIKGPAPGAQLVKNPPATLADGQRVQEKNES